MKQFSLKEYLKNPNIRVVTRDGRPARIICVDRKSTDRPIVSLVYRNGVEEPLVHDENGRYSFYDTIDNPFDLFFAPQKRSKWVFLYKTSKKGVVISSGVYDDKIQAEENCKSLNGFALTEITWEE